MAAKGANINESADNEGTTLHQAVLGNHTNVVEWLLANGARVDATTKGGMTPLHTAAEKGRSGIAKLLLNHHANVNARDVFGETPLYFAAVHRHADVAQVLLANGADANANLPNGVTSLHAAAASSSPEIVKALIARGSDVHALYQGVTPLHIAVEACFLQRKPPTLTPIIEMLFAAGAKPVALQKKQGGFGTTEVMTAGTFKVYAHYLEKSGTVENAISYYNKAAEIYDKMPQAMVVKVKDDPEGRAEVYAFLTGLSQVALMHGDVTTYSQLQGSAPGIAMASQTKDFKTNAKQLAEECRASARRLTSSQPKPPI